MCVFLSIYVNLKTSLKPKPKWFPISRFAGQLPIISHYCLKRVFHHGLFSKTYTQGHPEESETQVLVFVSVPQAPHVSVQAVATVQSLHVPPRGQQQELMVDTGAEKNVKL